tara:strand:- start:311 stop:487 length:177 start_codon:yes stop_codon:yes gene_type:complete
MPKCLKLVTQQVVMQKKERNRKYVEKTFGETYIIDQAKTENNTVAVISCSHPPKKQRQ